MTERVCERKRGAVGKEEIILDTEPIMFYSSAQEEGKVKAMGAGRDNIFFLQKCAVNNSLGIS